MIGATGEFSDTLTLDGGLVMGNVGDTTWGGFRLYMATMTSVDLPDSTTINSYPVVATHTTVLTISSDSYQGFSNLNVEAIATPPDHAITINRVRAYTVGTSTVQFSFAEYTFAGASGTDILSVSVATACNSGNTYTSFSNASIAAGSVAKITTGASSDTGSPTWVKFLIDWVYE